MCPCAISPSLKSFADAHVDRIVKILPFIKPRTKNSIIPAKHELHRLWAHLGRVCMLHGAELLPSTSLMLPLAGLQRICCPLAEGSER